MIENLIAQGVLEMLPEEDRQVFRQEAIRAGQPVVRLLADALRDAARRINGDAKVLSIGGASEELGDSTHRSAQAPTLGQGTKGNEKARKG